MIGDFMKKPLIIAPIYIETIAKVKQLPKGNEPIEPISTSQNVSGAGLIASNLFRELGLDYELISSCGTGIYGDCVKEFCTNNHILVHNIDNMNGSRYTLCDSNNETSQFIISGAEYEYDRNFTDDVLLSDISSVTVFGDMLMGEVESVSDLIETVEDLKKPFYFVPDGCLDNMIPETLDALLSFEPTLFLTDTEAYYLSNEHSGELRDTAQFLSQKTHAPVMVFKQSEGVFVAEKDDCYFAPQEDNIDKNRCFFLYLCAKQCGIDEKNAVMFATGYANKTTVIIEQRLKNLIMIK